MLNKKNKHSMLFISIILVLFIQVILNSTISVNAYDPTTNVVKADWLFVEAGSFADSSPHSWENEITINTGGIDLLEFNNLGIVSDVTNDDQVVYKARAKFGFEVTAHTSVDFRDFFPNINLASEHKEWFFKVDHFYVAGSVTAMYDITWTEVNYGATEQWHDYMGNVPITVGVLKTSGTSGSIDLNGVTFSTPEYISETISTKVECLRDGEVGSYEDIFTDVNEVEGGDVKLVVMDDFNDQQTEVINYYNDYNLGWDAGDIEQGQTLQQSMVSGAQPGTEFMNQYPMDNQFYDFGLSAKIQPEVYEYVQYNEIRRASIVYWHWGLFAGNIDPLYGPATETAPKRVVGVHTTNYFLHWDLTVEVDIYATIQSTAELTQSILGDPYLKAGDMVWDTSIVGAQHVELPLTTGDLWSDIFPSLIWIIVLVVIALIVYVFVQFGVPLIVKRKATKVVKGRIKS